MLAAVCIHTCQADQNSNTTTTKMKLVCYDCKGTTKDFDNPLCVDNTTTPTKKCDDDEQCYRREKIGYFGALMF